MKLGKYIAMSDRLTGEYKKAFDHIDSYGESHMVSGSYKNEKMMDLLDILLTAQQEETGVQRIVGTDWDQFSKDFFSDMTFADLAAIALARRNRFSRKVYIGMVIVFTLLAFGTAVWLGIRGHNMTVRAFPVILTAIVFLVIYYFCKLSYRYVKTGTFKKVRNEYDTTFTGLVKAEIGQIDYSEDPRMLKAYSRQYKKVNKKRAGKGLDPLTTKEYFEKKERENRYATLIGLVFGMLVPFGAALVHSDFESVFDAAMFVLWDGAVCAAVYFIFFKSADKMIAKENVNILRHCEETGLEIDELYQRYQMLSEK